MRFATKSVHMSWYFTPSYEVYLMLKAKNHAVFKWQLGTENDRLTSFDEVRRAAASITLLRTEVFTFLKPAITDIGTAICKEGKLVLDHNIQYYSFFTAWPDKISALFFLKYVWGLLIVSLIEDSKTRVQERTTLTPSRFLHCWKQRMGQSLLRSTQ